MPWTQRSTKETRSAGVPPGWCRKGIPRRSTQAAPRLSTPSSGALAAPHAPQELVQTTPADGRAREPEPISSYGPCAGARRRLQTVRHQMCLHGSRIDSDIRVVSSECRSQD